MQITNSGLETRKLDYDFGLFLVCAFGYSG